MNSINASGEAYLSHTKLAGQIHDPAFSRQHPRDEQHIEKVWRLLNEQRGENSAAANI